MRILLGLFLILLSLSAFSQVEKKALVIIDMQPDFVQRLGKDTVPANLEKTRRLIATQLELIENAKKANLPIIVVTFKKHGEMEESLKNSLKKYPKKYEVQKTTDSMFDDLKVQKDLFTYLKKENISELIITGANGGSCVFRSIYSALAYNYNVYAISDAIADFNYKEFIYPYEYSKNKFYRPKGCKHCKFEELLSQDANEKLFQDQIGIEVNQTRRDARKETSEQTETNQIRNTIEQ